MENAPEVQEESEAFKESAVHYEKFLYEVLSLIEGALGEFSKFHLAWNSNDRLCSMTLLHFLLSL